VNLEDLAPFVLPSVSGCPEPTLLHHLRQAAIEFCGRTLVWQQDLDPITSVAATDSYLLPMPADAKLVKLLAFTIDGTEAFVVTPEKGRRLAVQASSRDVAWTDDRTNVRINPVPGADGLQYVFKAALKPSQAAVAIPDEVGEHYARDIANGALAALLDLENVPWANPVKAATRRIDFEARMGRVAAQVAKGFSRGAQQVRGHYF
jgi:hypothetical protein